MFIIDLLFPKFCLGCGYLGVYLCQSCREKLDLIETDTCFYCKKPSLYGLTHQKCINKFNIDGMVALYHYGPTLKKVIKNFKYRLATEVWEEFRKSIDANIISRIGFYKRISNNLAIQPIPLAKKRFNERGFNQAQIIADYFGKFLGCPIVDLLVRKKEATAQAQTKDRLGRYLNVKGTFTVNDKCRDAKFCVSTSIILVDDVVTSGSTVREAARVLKQNGVGHVYVLALAKG